MKKQDKAIIFDIGRVLIDVDVKKGIFSLFEVDFEKGMDVAVQQLMLHPVFQLFNKGELTPRQFYEKIIEEFHIDIPFEEFKSKWCDIFTVMPGMYELVESVSCEYNLGLLSDTDPLHWDYLVKNYPIFKFFPNSVLSFRTNIVKPSSQIFKLAAESVNANPRDCIYIDDLPGNVEGAKMIGMDAIKFESSDKLRQEFFKRKVLE
jgi:putative hydrolase of the HAD superfamily